MWPIMPRIRHELRRPPLPLPRHALLRAGHPRLFSGASKTVMAGTRPQDALRAFARHDDEDTLG
jgi:hypothetical protein